MSRPHRERGGTVYIGCLSTSPQTAVHLLPTTMKSMEPGDVLSGGPLNSPSHVRPCKRQVPGPSTSIRPGPQVSPAAPARNDILFLEWMRPLVSTCTMIISAPPTAGLSTNKTPSSNIDWSAVSASPSSRSRSPCPFHLPSHAGLSLRCNHSIPSVARRREAPLSP
jgi:hypothetical protein